MKAYPYIAFILLCISISPLRAEEPDSISPTRNWVLEGPLYSIKGIPIDSFPPRFYQSDLPESYHLANGYTSNLGTSMLTKNYMARPETDYFLFMTPIEHWRVTPHSQRFYNSGIPITHLRYQTGGPKESAQDHLAAFLSGNINPKLSIGGNVDFIFSRGYYERQVDKDLIYSLTGSYIGDRYQIHVLLNQQSYRFQENGGISEDRYITDPDAVVGQGGVDTKTIPTNLKSALNHVKAGDYFVTQRYNFGFYRELPEQKGDTVIREEFVPVSRIVHAIRVKTHSRSFVSTASGEAEGFFTNRYFNTTATNDTANNWGISNTLGIELIEGFNKYAKAGLGAYLRYDYNQYLLMERGENYVVGTPPSLQKYGQSDLWIGAQLTKRSGKVLRYDLGGEVSLVGERIGNFNINAKIETRFALLGDTAQVNASGFLRNSSPVFYLNRYSSNNFIWDNNFGQTRRLRVGGEIVLPWTRTRIKAAFENVQNYIYFDHQALPQQESGILQVFSATLGQDFKLGPLHWENEILYQVSSNNAIIPLPSWTFYSNLYFDFKIARVLRVQLGAEGRYFTRYYSEAYQPATMSFHTQDKILIGDYPILSAYANMKLKMVRFYVMYSHLNNNMFLGMRNAFSLPHYPINPAMFQVGIAIDFTN